MATSMKNVEKPVVPIARSFTSSWVGFTSSWVGFSRCRLFFFLKKCVNMIIRENTDPIDVAMPAPIMPLSSVNTKK